MSLHTDCMACSTQVHAISCSPVLSYRYAACYVSSINSGRLGITNSVIPQSRPQPLNISIAFPIRYSQSLCHSTLYNGFIQLTNRC